MPHKYNDNYICIKTTPFGMCLLCLENENRKSASEMMKKDEKSAIYVIFK